MKYLIVGLGNPEPKYDLTRHNIGFLVADQVAGPEVFKNEKLGQLTCVRHKGRQVYVLKPNTYMNLSGKAVRYWMNELKIPIENILVVTDDLNLPFGKIRMKAKGSSGGHNGLSNIEQLLVTSKYPRLRFGIGADFNKGKQVNYVLENFSKTEMATIEERISLAKDAILAFCTIGLERAMNQYNGA